MNELTKFLVEGILNETAEKAVALFGGGFKPPTKGHLDVVNQGIKQNPEVSEVKILVGGGERNGFTQDQAVKIWNLYNDVGFIKKPATIIPVSSPFTYYKNYLKDNPDDKVFVFIGSRPDDEKDQMDVKQRSEFVKKYSDNVIPVEVSTTGGVSGTLARKLFKTDIDGFRNMFPENLLDQDFKKILDILNNKSTDNTRKSTPKATEPLTPLNEDPKKGTGKKPKGSGRRLYTDEDPKDTVGIKFSTRQDIVDTLGKKSFKAKSHARQSQIINLIHQRVRAALGRTKDPAKKKKLKSGFEYIKGKKEASKKKTQRLKKQKLNESVEKANKIFVMKSPFTPKGMDFDHIGFVLNNGMLKDMSGHRYDKDQPMPPVTYKYEDTEELFQMPKDKNEAIKKGLYKEKPLPKSIEIPDEVACDLKDPSKKAENCGSFVKIVLANNDIETTKSNKPGDIFLSLKENIDPKSQAKHKGKAAPFGSAYEPLNENATYSSKIDYKQQIKDLTKHMIKKGMNILPLPRVIFKHGDQENASQFLGKTAYYSPEDMTVVLYTEGRHPKDIARSFAHEMIHHIQNLEGRLGGINTTNTQEDDNLNDIEREAYTKGNMTFRNWTDSLDGEEVTSLNEKKKDLFGLDAYARELVKEVFNKTVTIDMDPIIKTLEFEMPTGQETDENAVAIIDAAPQGKVPHPVFLDFYAKFDKYFGEENDSRMLDNFGLEYLLSNVLNLPNEDIQVVMNHYNTTDQDSIEWFEQHDNELEKDEEHNIPGFDDANDDHESVINYRKKQLAKSLEEQERVRIFNPNCGCDKT